MDWKLLLFVALASGIGGAGRYLLSGWATIQDLPSGTLAVNVVGCFLIGLVVFGGTTGGWLSGDARIVIGIGLLGGFTTMSTFTYETLALLDSGDTLMAGGNILLTLMLCLGATWTGRALGLLLWSPGGA
jgi:fluoride exporter